MNALRLYFSYLAISIRAQMQYRASFLLQTWGQFLITGIEFLGLWALLDRFGNIRGWTLTEVALFYGVVNVSYATADAFARGFDTFGSTVRQGDFDRHLLRPRSTVLQLMGQELALKRIGRLLQGLIVLGWAASSLSVSWSIAKLVLLLAALTGGACLFLGLTIVQATIAFWTTETLEIMNTLTYGGVHTAQYPLSIYRPWLRQFFVYVVPLGCVCYFPVVAILDRTDPLGTAALVQWLSPAAGFLFLLVSLQLWKLGVRHYTSTGS